MDPLLLHSLVRLGGRLVDHALHANSDFSAKRTAVPTPSANTPSFARCLRVQVTQHPSIAPVYPVPASTADAIQSPLAELRADPEAAGFFSALRPGESWSLQRQPDGSYSLRSADGLRESSLRADGTAALLAARLEQILNAQRPAPGSSPSPIPPVQWVFT